MLRTHSLAMRPFCAARSVDRPDFGPPASRRLRRNRQAVSADFCAAVSPPHEVGRRDAELHNGRADAPAIAVAQRAAPHTPADAMASSRADQCADQCRHRRPDRRLSGGRDPRDRAVFRKAADSILVNSPQCSGEGSTCRVIARLWRRYFHLSSATDTGDGRLACNRSPRPSLTRDIQERRGRKASGVTLIKLVARGGCSAPSRRADIPFHIA